MFSTMEPALNAQTLITCSLVMLWTNRQLLQRSMARLSQPSVRSTENSFVASMKGCYDRRAIVIEGDWVLRRWVFLGVVRRDD